jgi:hypothetical protein
LSGGSKALRRLRDARVMRNSLKNFAHLLDRLGGDANVRRLNRIPRRCTDD